jgi:hypothetical protein
MCILFCLKDMGCTLNSSDNMQRTILVITTGPSNGIVSFTGTILTPSVLFFAIYSWHSICTKPLSWVPAQDSSYHDIVTTA